MPTAHNLGFPHLGAARELKRATEGYWGGKVSLPDLLKTGAELAPAIGDCSKDAGIDVIPRTTSRTTTACSICARWWAVCRSATAGPGAGGHRHVLRHGRAASSRGGRDITAMEMTKWFDTNYHYLVPEFEPDRRFGCRPRSRWTSSRTELEADRTRATSYTQSRVVPATTGSG